MIKLSRRPSRIFGPLIDPEKAELLKKSKAEIADKVGKVLKEHQVKEDGDPEDSKKVTELVELIEDFHKQYQSLYAVYDSLRGPPRNSSRIRKDKEGVPHPNSGSEDDEYYSPDEADLRYESEIAELKKEMASINEEKESLNREYKQALDKIQEADEKEKDLGNEAATQMKELEGQLNGLKVELETLHDKKTELESQVESQTTAVQELKYENLKLKTRVLELESEKIQEGDSLKNNENDLSSQHAELMSQYSNILQELISVQAQKDELEQRIESIKNEASDQVKESTEQVNGMKQELESLHTQNHELELRIESIRNEASAQVKDSTEQVNVMLQELESLRMQNHELASLRAQKDELEQRIESIQNEASSQVNAMQQELESLHIQNHELVSLRTQKDELEQRIESIRNEASSQVKESTEKVNVMQQELEALRIQTSELVSLHAQKDGLDQRIESIKNEASAQVKELTEQINVTKQELESMRIQSQASELQLESKSKEVSENLIQIETLREELAKITVERTLEENKEDPVAKIRDLKLEADTLLNQRNELEQQIKSKIHETTQMRDEKEKLQARIFELEGLVTAREKELSALRKKSESGEKQESTQSLITQNIAKFNKILSERPPRSLRVSDDTAAKVQPVEPRTRLESARSLNSQNITMFTKFVKESDESMTKYTKLYPQGAERKMEELAADFRRSIDDQIRLLTRRIRVLEQLHAENRESLRLTRTTLEHENNMLLAKVTTYEAALSKLRDLYEASKRTMKGLMFMVKKLEVGNKQLDRASHILHELQSAKNWIQGKDGDIRQMERDLDALNAQLQDKEKHISKLEAKVSQLEQKVEEMDVELSQLGQKVEEKDEELLCVGEEKREAIRQLSVLIDHHFTQNQGLKEMILKLRSRITQAAH